MKTILGVDDDAHMRARLMAAAELHREEFSLVVASHGGEAVRVLEERRVDGVLTDMWMPVMDGFQLLMHLMNRCPRLPVMVLSAKDPWDGLRGTGITPQLPCVSKSAGVHLLLSQVREHLETLARRAWPGVTLFGLLQLCMRERKTCVLEVDAGEGAGMLSVFSGEIIHARTARREGEEALFEMLRWEVPRLRLLPAPPEPRLSIVTRTEGLLTQAPSVRDRGASPRSSLPH